MVDESNLCPRVSLYHAGGRLGSHIIVSPVSHRSSHTLRPPPFSFSTPLCASPHSSSDFVYNAAEICSLALAAGCVVLMSTKLKSTYQKDVDSFGALHLPTEWGTLYIFVPCLLLAVVGCSLPSLLAPWSVTSIALWWSGGQNNPVRGFRGGIKHF